MLHSDLPRLLLIMQVSNVIFLAGKSIQMSDSLEESWTPLSLSVTLLELSLNPESAVSRNYSSGFDTG